MLAGDDHAFRLLVEQNKVYLFRIVFSVLKNEKEAEDALQEVFLKIYDSLPQYENQGFKTWISRIAVNHAIDRRRKELRRKEEVYESLETTGKLPVLEGVEKEVIQKEKRRIVRKRLEELPENYRDVIYGFYIEEKSYEQLAKDQNVHVKTIETKLYRARKWMKKHWKEEDFQ